MPKVICTIKHASDLINGVRFLPHAEGKVSEDLEQEQHDYFLSIPGFKKHEKTKSKPENTDSKKLLVIDSSSSGDPESQKPAETENQESKELANGDDGAPGDDDTAKTTDTPAQVDAKAERKAAREAAALAAAAGK